MLYGGNYFIQRDVVETKNARIWKREDGIIEIKFNEGVVETLDSAKEIFKVAKRLNEGKNGLVLVDATDIVYIVGEARHYLATDNEIKRLTKRLAILLIHLMEDICLIYSL
jgi:hypothetical protein